MPAPAPLQFLAGRAVRAHVEANGLRLADFPVVLGAAGGPKWLALHGLDRVLAPRIRASGASHDLVGASIGAWRFAAWIQRDPIRSLDALRDCYCAPAAFPPRRDGFAEAFRGFLDAMLDHPATASHPSLRVHAIVTALRTGGGNVLPALARAALLNAVSRRRLECDGAVRLVFSTSSSEVVRAALQPSVGLALDGTNLSEVLLASGAVPGLVPPIRHLHPDPDLVALDGGLLDYHFEPQRFGTRFVLYPHFYPHLTPGWFDKWLPARRRNATLPDHVLLLAPHPEWVARLPGGHVPDRRDGPRMSDAERVRAWRAATAASAELGDCLDAALESGRMP